MESALLRPYQRTWLLSVQDWPPVACKALNLVESLTISPMVQVRSRNDVSMALMAVSEEIADATKREVAIIRLELEGVSKRVSTQFVTESQAAILRNRAELERDDSEALRISRLVGHCCTIAWKAFIVVFRCGG